MSRQHRRRVERQIRKLIETDGDNCSICRSPFRHNHRTYGGITAAGAAAVVADCCVKRLASVHTVGIFINRDYGLPQAKSVNDAYVSPDAIEINVARLQEAVAKADAISKKAGISANVPDWQPHPWKADDAKWFKENPSRSHRLRAGFPDEPPSQHPPADHIPLMLIRQVEPGTRVKIPLVFHREFMPVPDSDALLRAIFDVCTESIPMAQSLPAGGWVAVSRNKIKELTKQYLAAEQAVPS
jgi:hypothetical protein